MNKQEIKLNGLVLRKTNFRETSVIIDLLTAEFGKIAVIAKGVRSSKSELNGVLELLNELELDLFHKAQSDWYLVKSASQIHTYLYDISFSQSVLMQAATEIIRQLHIPHEDQESIYILMKKYLKYIPTINKNGIAVFWRFLMRLLIILGINLDFGSCVLCKQKKNDYAAFSIRFHGLICSSCFRPSLGVAFSSSKEVSYILNNIGNIGNILENLEISKSTINQINRMFLDHLEEHFQKKFYLKSLDLYKA